MTNETIIPQPLVRAASFNIFWYLFIRIFLWKPLNNLILWDLFDVRTGTPLINVNLIGKGDSWYSLYCTDFTALAANVNNNNNTCDIQSQQAQRASRRQVGTRACTLCIEGFMESFYLFSYCILIVTQIGKEFLEPVFWSPSSDIKSPISGILFFLNWFTQLSSCVFLINQTSMMLY